MTDPSAIEAMRAGAARALREILQADWPDLSIEVFFPGDGDEVESLPAAGLEAAVDEPSAPPVALPGPVLVPPPGGHAPRTIQPWKRDVVLSRDGHRCVNCGSKTYLHVDHIEPVALGGGSDLNNLQTLCRICNLRKGARPAPPPPRLPGAAERDRIKALHDEVERAEKEFDAAIGAPVLNLDERGLERWRLRVRAAGERRDAAREALGREVGGE